MRIVNETIISVENGSVSNIPSFICSNMYKLKVRDWRRAGGKKYS